MPPTTNVLPTDYQMLFEIGRTEASIVYCARDRAVRRTVAVKLLRPGSSAEPRLRAEAQSNARVQHPGVAALYQVSEHEGSPLLVFEYCPEGSLAKKLSAAPLPPKDAAILVQRLAVATQAIHDAKLVHRDLTPVNVLLAEDGSPRITGFGSARRLDELGTATTGNSGTSASMSPEQARGEKTIGPAADIYALGVILYECLTGRPPFRAATPTDTLQQVIDCEPAPPSLLNPAVPRELESIALKCLAKVPAQRYSSAKELSAALERILANPTAMQTSAKSRSMGWLQRNPLVVALAALLLLALLLGTAASTFFSLEANRKTLEAQTQAARLEQQDDQLRLLTNEKAATVADLTNKLKQSEQTAQQNQKRALESEQKATQTIEKLESALATSLLRPIGQAPARFDHNGRNVVPLDPTEAHALVMLGEQGERVRQRLLEFVLSDPRAANRVSRRAPWIVQATVGLDRGRRKQVETLLLQGLPAKTPEVALVNARLGIELNVTDTRWAKDSASTLLLAMNKTTDANLLNALAHTLNAVCESLHISDAIQPCSKAAEIVIAAMSKSADPGELHTLAIALQTIGERLPSRIASEQVAKAAKLLIRAKELAKTPAARQSLVLALHVVVARLNASDAATIAALLASEAERATDPHHASLFAQALKPTSKHLEAAPATDYAGKIAETLVAAMGKTADVAALQSLLQALNEVSEKLDEKRSVLLAEAIVAIVGKTTDPQALHRLAQAMKAVGEKLDAKQGKHAALAEALVALVGKTNDRAALDALAQGLKAISDKLDPKQSASAAETIAALVTKSIDADVTTSLARALGAVGGRLDAEQAAKVARPIVTALVGSKQASDADSLALALKTVGPRLNAEEADKTAASIVTALHGITNPAMLDALAQGLNAVNGRTDAKQASKHAAEAAKAIIEVLEKDSQADSLFSLAHALLAVGERLDAKDANAAAEVTLSAMSKARSTTALVTLVRTLGVLIARVEATAREKFGTRAASLLVGTLGQSRADDVPALVGALAEICERIDAKEASALAGKVAANAIAGSKSGETTDLASLGVTLRGVGKRVDAKAASHSTEAVLAALHKTSDAATLELLVDALGAISDRLTGEKDKTLETLIILTAQASEQGSMVLSRGLKSMARSRSKGDLLSALSHPLCAGTARRALLDEVGTRHKREFRSVWQYLDME